MRGWESEQDIVVMASLEAFIHNVGCDASLMRLQNGSKVAAEQDLAWTKWVLDKQFRPTQDEEPKLSV
jgi:hypothetical protein